jgi:Dolichyl-phosphate-mannose-protein mannosyltransferase
MNIDSRFNRLIFWLGILGFALIVLLGAVRFGIGLIAVLWVLGVLGALVFRIATLGNRDFEQRMEMPHHHGVSVDDPLPAFVTPEMAAPSTPDWRAAIAGRLGRAVSGAAEAVSTSTTESGVPSLRWVLMAVTVLLSLGVPLAFRLYRLPDLQAEVYGDINIVFEYMQWIQSGVWPFVYVLSSGPLYHYWIAPIVALTGLSYTGLKLASVFVSLFALLGVWLTVRRVEGESQALLALFVTGVSSWLLIFSRLGNSQIAVPGLVMISLWLLVRHIQTGRLLDIGLCALISALGFYGYPQSFVVSPVLFATMVALRVAGHRLTVSSFLTYLGVTLIAAIPFVSLINGGALGPSDGYIFGKLLGAENPLGQLATNISSMLLAFHVRGDSSFRSNIAGAPHLDMLSGLFVLAGIVYWFRKPVRKWALLWLVPFVLLQMPSILVLASPGEVPSASRTLGVSPILGVWVASGVWWLFAALRNRMAASTVQPAWLTRVVPPVALMLAAGLIALLNGQRYFVDYMRGLPYQNTPIARLVTDYVNLLPHGTHVYLYNCCWEGGMPEPKGIEFEMNAARPLVTFLPGQLTCDNISQQLRPPAVLIWSHREPVPAPELAACLDQLPGQTFVSPSGLPVFNAATWLPGGSMRVIGPLESPLPTSDSMVPTQVTEGLSDLISVPEDAEAGSLVPDVRITGEASLRGVPIRYAHSALDMGAGANLFDGDPNTLIRGVAANPFVLMLELVQPESVGTLEVRTQTLTEMLVIVRVRTADNQELITRSRYSNTEPSPVLTFNIASVTQGAAVREIYLEFLDLRAKPGEGYHMHVYEVALVD